MFGTCLTVHIVLASFPGLKRRRKAWFHPFAHVLNHGGIPPPPHTIDILAYTRDTRIDTKRNTVHRFIIAAYGMQLTRLYSINRTAAFKVPYN